MIFALAERMLELALLASLFPIRASTGLLIPENLLPQCIADHHKQAGSDIHVSGFLLLLFLFSEFLQLIFCI